MMLAVAQNIWFLVPASLALETGLLALMLGLALRGTQSPGWRRTLCQAALLCALLITVCEVSGAGRAFAGWVSTNLARRVWRWRPACSRSCWAWRCAGP